MYKLDPAAESVRSPVVYETLFEPTIVVQSSITQKASKCTYLKTNRTSDFDWCDFFFFFLNIGDVTSHNSVLKRKKKVFICFWVNLLLRKTFVKKAYRWFSLLTVLIITQKLPKKLRITRENRGSQCYQSLCLSFFHFLLLRLCVYEMMKKSYTIKWPNLKTKQRIKCPFYEENFWSDQHMI